MQWFLLFRLSQFVVHLFTFLLVSSLWPGKGLVLGGLLLGATHPGRLPLFGLLHGLALARGRGGRGRPGLSGFGPMDTRFVYLQQGVKRTAL